jgi:hypothetical protein
MTDFVCTCSVADDLNSHYMQMTKTHDVTDFITKTHESTVVHTQTVTYPTTVTKTHDVTSTVTHTATMDHTMFETVSIDCFA